MAENTHEEKRGTRGLAAAVMLIGIGLALVLSNLGVIGQINLLALLPYWPVLIILIGLDLMLGRSPIGGALAAVIGLAAVAGVVYIVSTAPTELGGFALGETETLDVTQPLGDVSALEVVIEVGAGEVTLTGGAENGFAAQGQLTFDSNYASMVTYEQGQLTIARDPDSSAPDIGDATVGTVDLRLPDDIPLTVRLDLGAADADINLSDVQLQALVINSGAGSVTVELPDEGRYTVEVNFGAGALTLIVPEGINARLTRDGLFTADLPSRYEKIADGRWETPRYAEAEHRTTITINAGLGALTVSDSR